MIYSIIHKIFKPKDLIHSDFNSKKIEKIINYNFKNKSLLFKAFKHRSFLAITNESYVESNERLEFLGDSILGQATTDLLFHEFPQEPEGILSQMKSVLVSRSVLSDICHELGLGEFLLIDKGEKKTGGKKRLSNLANLYEAIIGAIYLDGGYKPAEKFIKQSLLDHRNDILNKEKHYNYKSILLEYSQSKGLGSPLYKLADESGPDHYKFFIIEVRISEDQIAKGEGRSKKIAEQNAAQNLLKIIDPQLIEN
jgi:ribonuclease III